MGTILVHNYGASGTQLAHYAGVGIAAYIDLTDPARFYIPDPAGDILRDMWRSVNRALTAEFVSSLLSALNARQEPMRPTLDDVLRVLPMALDPSLSDDVRNELIAYLRDTVPHI